MQLAARWTSVALPDSPLAQRSVRELWTPALLALARLDCRLWPGELAGGGRDREDVGALAVLAGAPSLPFSPFCAVGGVVATLPFWPGARGLTVTTRGFVDSLLTVLAVVRRRAAARPSVPSVVYVPS